MLQYKLPLKPELRGIPGALYPVANHQMVFRPEHIVATGSQKRPSAGSGRNPQTVKTTVAITEFSIFHAF
jgi:hypothetical protein